MDSNNFKLLRRILVADFDVSAEAVTSDAQLYESLDLDSIDAVDLIVRLKEETGKRVPPDDFKAVRTIGDVVKVLDAL
ncbi:MAG: acyl carrier protein [Gammaproteobacteria bacterium]|jgi:acyl carrier protein|nr:acyl carrier protein [Gammaproteobacteria bacterium]